MGFPGGSDRKESVCNAGDLGSVPGLGRSPGEGEEYWLHTPGFWPGEFHGQRSLAGYSPRVTQSRTRLSNFHYIHSSTIDNSPEMQTTCISTDR